MNAERTHLRGHRESGFSLFEMMMTLTIFSVIFTSLFVVIDGVQTSYDEGNTRSVLRESGRRVLKEMIYELRQTGIIEGGAVNLPAIYERPVARMGDDNQRGALLATMSFGDAELGGQVGTGENRVITHVDRTANEIVFRRLTDLDGNGYPFAANTGDLEWGAEEFSYYVVEDASGNPQLVRESSTGAFRIIGRNVEKVVVDVISYDPTVLYNQIVIVVYMIEQLPDGSTLRVGVEGTVNLRNTRELEG